jgi:gluconokinase
MDNKNKIKESIMVVDIGSSSIKTSLFDTNARNIPKMSVKVHHKIKTNTDGTSEANPQDLRRLVEKSIDLILEKSRVVVDEIIAVSFDSMASTILGVDDDGKAITPMYTYADTRTYEQVDKIKLDLDESNLHDRTGVMQHTSYVPARIMWLKKTNPYLAKRIYKYLDFSTYLFSNWFKSKDYFASYSISSWSGLLNRYELDWDSKLLEYLSIKSKNLPQLKSYKNYQIGLNKIYSKRWPNLFESKFFLSVGDGVSANIGSGCIDENKIALTIGSTGAMRVILKNNTKKISKGLWSYKLGKDRSLLGGSFSEGGNLINWANDNLKLPKNNQFDSYLSKLTPGQHGLSILPFFSGERSIGWSNNSLGVISGIKLSNSSIDILQALLESVAYRFYFVYQLLKKHTNNAELFISGEAIKNSSWWIQTISDVLNIPLRTLQQSEDTSRGTAILCLNSLGILKEIGSLESNKCITIFPDEKKHKIHQEYLSNQTDLYKKNILN